jgi:2-hydroxychromene-2-carboxylate isomerase
MRTIDFYFDFSSPYGYFMSEKIDALAAQYGRSVSWRPILLFATLRSLGLPPPFEHPVKRDYITTDFARSAQFMGIDYKMPPQFPALTQYAARAFYLLQAKAPTHSVPLAKTVLRSYFCDGHDISSIDVIAQLVCAQSGVLGTHHAVCDLLKADEAKILLQNAITKAVGEKVFGSPFIVIDDESFFGVDRLPQITKKLAAST